MKTIGLLGGMSWESTLTYYRVINEEIKQALGGYHSAKIVLYSVDFAEIEAYQTSGEWDKSAQVLTTAAQALEMGGADFVLICTNTMHKVAPQVQAGIHVPLLHIAEATAALLNEQGIGKVALLGTKYTMTQDFYKDKLIEAGIEVLVPDPQGIEEMNRIIFEELCLGTISEDSRSRCLEIIRALENRGAQGVVLGCTEIGLLIEQQHTRLPVFDTALIHASKAAQLALS
ncbi:aspartate/glutamate racemase family protein [Eubacteriales bacterium OttesenSCG-928-N13]|nr:aspartate/glutamate racemase family protein [Eubacteriales bacterium OttesenSCG-928-N13]